MSEYRISKYNPSNRINEIYVNDEWTSISDIGKKFSDGVLTEEDYYVVEKRYIKCCLDFTKILNLHKFHLCKREAYDTNVFLPRIVQDETQLSQILQLILEEKCWAVISAKKFRIHFGFDYYMYIETELTEKLVKEIVNSNNLFCERYNNIELK